MDDRNTRMNSIIVTIIGRGFVGKATGLLESKEITVWYYDVVPELCSPPELSMDRILQESHIVFICVPTPMNIDGSCNTSIVESVLHSLRDHPLVVIRSTVPIGYADAQNCFFMPEFLTEKNWPVDFRHCPLWIFGSPVSVNAERDARFREVMTRILGHAAEADKILHTEAFFCTNCEAEMIKLLRNNFLSTKVVFFNHVFDLCKSLDISYDAVIHGVRADPRIGASHTLVDGKEYRGYGGTCFPKDTNSLFHIFQENGVQAPLLEANLVANEYLLNPHKPWMGMYNRAITEMTGRILLYTGLSSSVMEEIVTLLDSDEELYIIGVDTHLPIETEYHPHFYFKQIGSTGDALFVPKAHQVIHTVKSSLPKIEKMKAFLRAHDFARVYELPFKVRIENVMEDSYFLDL